MKAKNLHPYGLNEKEQKVLECISQKPISLANATLLTKLPRSTTEYILKKLEHLKLIEKIPHSKRFLFQSFPNIVLCGPLTLYQGPTAIHSLWQEMAGHGKESRLIGIQPYHSFKQAIRKTENEKVVNVSQKLTDQRFIIDAILHEGIFNILANEIPDEKKLKKTAKVFVGRPEDIVKVNRDFLDEKSEMYMIGEMLIFIDWFKEVGIKIVNKNIQGLMKTMFYAVKAYGTRYHQGSEIEKNIK